MSAAVCCSVLAFVHVNFDLVVGDGDSLWIKDRASTAERVLGSLVFGTVCGIAVVLVAWGIAFCTSRAAGRP